MSIPATELETAMTDRRLLILDDDPDIAQMIKVIAETIGVIAQTTVSPEEFFTLVAEWQPTDIAVDLIMPQMDGVQVLAKLAEQDCLARIIITSGVGNRVLDAAGRSAAEHGLDIAGVLSKPFTPSQLRQLLGSYVSPATSKKQLLAGTGHVVTEQELRDAITKHQLYLMYQPKVDCTDRQLAGFEVLVRWQHPEYGNIAPDRFIPLAESCGLIEDITYQVLEQALDWYSTDLIASKVDGQTIMLSINISARSLEDPFFIDHICEVCDGFGVNPSSVIFELTETSAMQNPVESLDLLTRLRMKKFQLSIDDFGTGFSSMIQLVRLPFSEIKVDKSFVLTAVESQESRTVVKSIVELGRSLGLRSTAEGVEDEATLKYLAEIRCDLAQGYFIAAPMKAADAIEWIDKHYRGI